MGNFDTPVIITMLLGGLLAVGYLLWTRSAKLAALVGGFWLMIAYAVISWLAWQEVTSPVLVSSRTDATGTVQDWEIVGPWSNIPSTALDTMAYLGIMFVVAAVVGYLIDLIFTVTAGSKAVNPDETDAVQAVSEWIPGAPPQGEKV